MGFLTPAASVIANAMAAAMFPPPPPDITAWCEENIVFDERSPMPGPFNIDRFAFLREIHDVLSPEHPCREVTIKGSAQWGKTVSIIQPVLGAWHAYTPLDSLVVHPTLAEFSTATGHIVLTDAATGEYTITLTPADLSAVSEGTRYAYNIWTGLTASARLVQAAGQFILKNAIEPT